MSAALIDHRGTSVGSDWLLLDAIGSGATATVYRAVGADGQLAAVKLMHAHLTGLWSTRFEREARLLRRLEHAAVPRLLEFGRFEGRPFLVMELLSGSSLSRAAMPDRTEDRQTRILACAVQALDALNAVHAHGILHRDLKPSNLFLTDVGGLKVLDFGAAASPRTLTVDSDSLTNGVLGTPAFMSPEQARGRWDLVDVRSDLWSLAAAIFSLLSNQHVHRARTVNEQLGFAMARSARPVRNVVPTLDARIAGVLDRALAYRREDRFQSAAEFRDVLLASCRAGAQTPPPTALDATLTESRSEALAPISSKSPSRVRGQLVAAGVSVALLALHADHAENHSTEVSSGSQQPAVVVLDESSAKSGHVTYAAWGIGGWSQLISSSRQESTTARTYSDGRAALFLPNATGGESRRSVKREMSRRSSVNAPANSTATMHRHDSNGTSLGTQSPTSDVQKDRLYANQPNALDVRLFERNYGSVASTTVSPRSSVSPLDLRK